MKLSLFLFFVTIQFIYAQQFNGNLLDKDTGEPVPYAHIYFDSLETGTVSNELGEFVLSIPLKLTKIWVKVSHVAYETTIVVLKSGKIETLQLNPASQVLDEVVVDDQAYGIAKEVYTQLMQEAEVTFGKAYYKQITMDGENATELLETFNHVSINANGIQEHKIVNGRYARKLNKKEQPLLFYANFSYLTFGFKLSGSEKSTIARPFDNRYIDQYSFSIERRFKRDGKEYAVVSYSPEPEIPQPALYGDFTVQLPSNRLTQFTAKVNHSLGVDQISSSSNQAIASRNYAYSWELNLSENANLYPSLDYLMARCQFEWSYDNNDFRKVTASASIVVYEKNTKKLKGLKQPKIEVHDLRAIQSAKYNPRFWKDNPVIKRTPFEEKIISSFEAKKAFSNYLK